MAGDKKKVREAIERKAYALGKIESKLMQIEEESAGLQFGRAILEREIRLLTADLMAEEIFENGQGQQTEAAIH